MRSAPGSVFRNAVRNAFVHGLLHDDEERGADGLGKARLQHRQLVDGDPVRPHDRSPDDLGDFFSKAIGTFRSLHQGRYNVLLCKEATKVVLLGLHLRFVVEDRRMAGMGDEVGKVVPLRQMAREGSCRVEGYDHGPWLQLVDDARSHLANRRIGDSQDDDLCPFETSIGSDAIDAEIVFQPRLAGVANLDMADVEARTFQVLCKTVAHFATGAEEGNCGHVSSPFL